MEPELSSHDQKELKRQHKEDDRERQRAAAEHLQRKLQRKNYLLYGLGALLVLGVVWFLAGGAPFVLEIGDHPWFGPQDGKVEFVVFGDFQCPFTKKFFLGAYQQVAKEFGEKIKIAFLPMPTNRHANDRLSAQAAYCANDQGKFWEYAKVVFERQGRADSASLVSYAGELGLDAKKFGECVQSSKYADKVNADFKAGRKLGVTVTPTVFVNGNPLYGDLPFEEYKTLIEWALAQGTM